MIDMHPKLAMLAKAGDPESVRDAVVEPKLDGHRVLAFMTANGPRLYARTGVDKTAKLPKIVQALRGLPVGTILDGEVVSWSAKGGDWAAVQSVLGADDGRSSDHLTYVVFDVLSLMGESTMLYPLRQRRAFLDELIQHTGASVELIQQVEFSTEAVDNLMQGISPEGVIVKDANGTYQSGKRGWIKVKASETEDVVVMGATDGKGAFGGMVGALIFGQYVKSPNRGHGEGREFDYSLALVEAGQCSGMTLRERLEFSELQRRGDLAGTVIEIRHMGRMPSGGLRHPQFMRVRTDKTAAECVAS